MTLARHDLTDFDLFDAGVLSVKSRVSVKHEPDGGGWRMTKLMRIQKCGCKNEHGKMRMTKSIRGEIKYKVLLAAVYFKYFRYGEVE